MEPGALPKVSVMSDLSCHQQAIISVLRDHGGDARIQLSSCLPFGSFSPISLATVVQAAGTFHWIEAAGKAAPQNTGCASQPPSQVMDGALCLAAASLEADSWHGERDGVSTQPLHPLNAFQLYFTELFTSPASQGGVWVSSKQGCARRRMPNTQTLEGTGTRVKGEFPFISDSNLSKK